MSRKTLIESSVLRAGIRQWKRRQRRMQTRAQSVHSADSWNAELAAPDSAFLMTRFSGEELPKSVQRGIIQP